MADTPSQGPDAVSVTGLELHYDKTVVLNGIDLSLKKGRTLALLGPSGCGKTTLLRLVAGLLAPTKGTVAIAGQTVADGHTRTFLPPEKRNLGMVFQDYALWPHLTVAGNVSFPLEMRGIDKDERRKRTLRALERVGLAALADRRPSDLSGGQQQRVAIARAIVAEPQLILFDEPLSNLDRELRESMVGELAELIATLDLTAIYVTHDHSEALTLADEVAVMRAGMIAQLAPPDVLINKPASPYVAEFLRLGSTLDVEWSDAAWRLAGSSVAIARATGKGDRKAAKALIPLQAITVKPTAEADLHVVVQRSQFRGDGHLLTAAPAGTSTQTFQALSQTKVRPGETVGLSIDENRILWF